MPPPPPPRRQARNVCIHMWHDTRLKIRGTVRNLERIVGAVARYRNRRKPT